MRCSRPTLEIELGVVTSMGMRMSNNTGIGMSNETIVGMTNETSVGMSNETVVIRGRVAAVESLGLDRVRRVEAAEVICDIETHVRTELYWQSRVAISGARVALANLVIPSDASIVDPDCRSHRESPNQVEAER